MNRFESQQRKEIDVEPKEINKEELAREETFSEVGHEPTKEEYKNEEDFIDAQKEYWDKYYDVYYEKMLGLIYGRNKITSKDYKFFRSKEEREDVFEFSKAIAEYIKNNDIKDLIIADRSSRPLYIGVKEYWSKMFPNKQPPGIYFVNPKGFKSADATELEKLEKARENAYWKQDLDESLEKARPQQEIMEEFKEVYPHLVADKNQLILIFDTCIHSGDTLSSVVETFKKLKFKNVKIGSVNPADSHSAVQTDFFITAKRPEKGCYPFDRDRLIEKTFEHVYSKPSSDEQKREGSVSLRKEIKKIMQEHLE